VRKLSLKKSEESGPVPGIISLTVSIYSLRFICPPANFFEKRTENLSLAERLMASLSGN
jgi:hypothetical protein